MSSEDILRSARLLAQQAVAADTAGNVRIHFSLSLSDTCMRIMSCIAWLYMGLQSLRETNVRLCRKFISPRGVFPRHYLIRDEVLSVFCISCNLFFFFCALSPSSLLWRRGATSMLQLSCARLHFLAISLLLPLRRSVALQTSTYCYQRLSICGIHQSDAKVHTHDFL